MTFFVLFPPPKAGETIQKQIGIIIYTLYHLAHDMSISLAKKDEAPEAHGQCLRESLCVLSGEMHKLLCKHSPYVPRAMDMVKVISCYSPCLSCGSPRSCIRDKF